MIAKEKTHEVKAHVSDLKIKRVSELSDLIKKSRSILVASIKNIPGSQFQEIVKNLRGKAIVKVPKKSLVLRAIDSSGNGDILKLKEKIDDSVAILFSDVDAFELAAELVKNKKPARTKEGQIAPIDIEIPEGPTDLVPGPAITELSSLGIPIQIEKGKIHIKQTKVIAKAGEKISKAAAEMANKFNISPFTISFVPLCAFDNKDKKLYTEINIDTEKTVEEIKIAFGKALPFAVEIGYVNDETLTFLLGKAGRNEKVIEGLLGKEVGEKTEEDEANSTTLDKKEGDKGKESSNINGEELKPKEKTEPSGESIAQQENKSQENQK